jgi:hypothetical protein
MVIARGARLVAIDHKWGNGFRKVDGTEWDIVGVRFVGGSYLTHITNTVYCFTGIFVLKTFANRSKPLPLLVVHSGNTTTGLRAERRISSRLRKGTEEGADGVLPVEDIISNKDT